MLKKLITGLLAAALGVSALALAGCGGNEAKKDGSFPIAVDGSSQSSEAVTESTTEPENVDLPESYQIQDVHPIFQSELKAGCETYAATMLSGDGLYGVGTPSDGTEADAGEDEGFDEGEELEDLGSTGPTGLSTMGGSFTLDENGNPVVND